MALKGVEGLRRAEAHLSGGDVEVPKAGYLAKLDQAHQMGLFPHIVDPVSDLTPTQWEQGHQELTEWEAGGGTAKLQADVAAADAETAANPEHVAVKEDLRGRYEAAGVTPEVAEALATKDANVYSNLARGANLKPSEVLTMYNPKVTAGEAPVGTEAALHQKAIEDIRSVVEAAKQEGHASQKATIAPVHSWIVDAAKDNGIDIEGYSHVVDGSAVRHVINRHGNEAVETSRGQLPVSDADFDRIPSIIDKPDQVVLGTKTKGNKDQIGYMKRLEDGTTLYLEEARTGKKELATVSMRKYPATKDFDDIAATLPSNARGDGGNKPIIVQPPDSDEILHQSQIPAWFKNQPAPAEGEDHPSLVQLRDKATASGVPLNEEHESAAREAIDAAARGDDAVWSAAQEKYQKLRDEDPRTAELRAAQEVYSKAQAEVTDDPTPELTRRLVRKLLAR